MIFVGVDFSITSTAVCILKDGKYHWLNFSDNVKMDNKPYIHHKKMQDFVEIHSYERKVPKDSYTITNAYNGKRS